MGRLSASLLALALGAFAALGLVACGGGNAELLPGRTASEINSNLDQVQELVSAGDCIGAEDAAQAVSSQVEALDDVDEKLKQALREGAARLTQVVAECDEAPEEEETAPAVEPAEELEEGAKEKPAKPKKPKQEAEAAPEETTPALPPQAEGEAKGHEQAEGEAPAAEVDGGTPSGGVGPGAPVGGE